MDSITEDLWAIILSRLPLKTITTLKLVCKQWKSLLESPFLRDLFMSHHQNSQSSWSLMCRDSPEEVVAHYGCDVWGLPRSLASYVTSFITARFYTKRKWIFFPKTKEVRVLAYTEVGLILIYVASVPGNRAYYVANPVSRQCVKIPPIPTVFLACETDQSFTHARLFTRTENGVLGYKVVLIEIRNKTAIPFVTFIIYSSVTGLWSSKTLDPPFPLICFNHRDSITLKGNLHWLGLSLDQQDVIASFDFFGSDHQFRVKHFPDSEIEPKFKRCCSTSQGNLMYLNIAPEYKDDGSVDHKLSVWRLKNGEWQRVCEISPYFIKTGYDYLPLAINPFDCYTMYLCQCGKMYDFLASINLRNGNYTVHNVLECSRNILPRWLRVMVTSDSYFSTFVLPRWLYRIPQPPRLEEFIDIPRD